ncbi:MAG: protein translocase subunit SecD [Firmicutes bacterium]|nr:protein translocase subunit SecD [Bacillota bacterium]
MRRKLIFSVVITTVICLASLGGVLAANWRPKLGLDLAGGLSVVFVPAHPVPQSELQTAVNVMDNRLNGLGVAQPNVTTEGNQIVVQLPGIKNPQETLKVIGTTAQLFFRPVLGGAPAYTPPKATKGHSAPKVAYKVPPTPAGGYLYSSAYYSTGSSGNATYSPPATDVEDPIYADYPTTSNNNDNPSQNVILPSNGQIAAPRMILGPAYINGQEADGQIISSATAAVNQTGQWIVQFTLSSSGGTIFNDLASKYYKTLVADDLDGQVISAPIIEASHFNGSGQITGNFTSQEASNLALDLNYGSLPVRLVQETAQTVSPSLGSSSLTAGLFAGILGLLLVMIYTIIYYRALGIVVLVGLATTAALIYGLVSILGNTSFGLTLDLSGVTGLIVSIGITVDSYVVYFERLKDEVRAGKSIRASVDKSFKSAYRTILSADAVSFLAALILWILSVGAVKGFAFMLGLSTLIDVLTSYFFTRPLVILLGSNRFFTEARWVGVARGLAAYKNNDKTVKSGVVS